MHARFASIPNTGIKRWRTKLNFGMIKATMQVKQLSALKDESAEIRREVTVRKRIRQGRHFVVREVSET